MWVPHRFDHFVLVAIRSPQSQELDRILSNDIMPWIRLFKRRKSYLQSYIAKGRAQRKEDLRFWRDEEPISLSQLYVYGRFPEHRWPFGLNASHANNLEYYRGLQYIVSMLDDYQEDYGVERILNDQLPLQDVESYVPPPSGHPRPDDDIDIFMGHWVWRHQFDLQ
ncbi:hypothetical protein GOP47_0019963 [Adiantum capillus-veneris]|uniref:Uncharacterized protein n=1 Tax=Adiantum capillus-veneris TaxID=13818 RepID=A0A9D4UD17_ADICA|nr:hypothetical protein GOP47_0019963 [Adiantum capillus-veneris]